MKVVGNFNNVSTKPPKLKKGEVVRYQMLNGTDEVDENGAKTGRKIFPAATRIPTRDRITDPVTGEVIDIGVVEKVDKDKEVTKTKAYFADGVNGGNILLTGGNIDHEELYEYFELCNYNESNENRDTNVEPLFRRIDRKKEADKFIKQSDNLLNALNYVSYLKGQDVRELAASLNWNELEDLEVLKADLREYAMKYPDALIKMIDDPDIKRKSELKQSLTAGFIKYDVHTHKVLWGHNDVSIAQLDRVPGANFLDQLNDWIKTNKNGDNIMQALRKSLRGELREKVREASKEAQSQ
jgi:hypothetical protein